jgi:hypothetical protein
MAVKTQKHVATPAPAQVVATPAPVATTAAPVAPAPVATTAAPKAVRYAPTATLANLQAVITAVHPSNPKINKPGNTSYLLWDKYIAGATGKTVAQVCQDFVAGGLTAGRAKRFLRWAIARNHVTLG